MASSTYKRMHRPNCAHELQSVMFIKNPTCILHGHIHVMRDEAQNCTVCTALSVLHCTLAPYFCTVLQMRSNKNHDAPLFCRVLFSRVMHTNRSRALCASDASCIRAPCQYGASCVSEFMSPHRRVYGARTHAGSRSVMVCRTPHPGRRNQLLWVYLLDLSCVVMHYTVQ